MGIVDDRVIKVGDAGAEDSKPGKPMHPSLKLHEIGISEQSFVDSLFKAAPFVVLVLDTEGKIILFNPYTEELTGLGLDQVRGTDWFSAFVPDNIREFSRKRFKSALRARQWQGSIVTPIVAKGGRRRLVEWHDVALREERGDVVGLLAIGQDVTDRKQAEKDLKKSREQLRKTAVAEDNVLRNTMDALPQPFYVIDAETYEVVLANPAAKGTWGKQGATCFALTHGRREPCCGDDHPCPLQKVKQTKQAHTVEHVHEEGPGGPRILEIHAYPIMDSEGRVVQVIEFSLDITKRRQAEDAIRDNQKRFKAIWEANPDPMVVYDKNGDTTQVNPAFTQLFGWSFKELKGRPIPFVPEEQKPAARAKIKELFLHGNPVSLETRRLTKQGATLDISISTAGIKGADGKVSGAVVNLKDLTEKKKLEARLQQAQKMEAIGTLAGGIAHDFNNILGAMIGYTELVLSGMAEDTPSRWKLEQVLQAGDRAKSLVKQILSFSFHAEPEQKPIKIGPIITEALELIRASIPATVEIRQHIKAETGMVLANPTQIHQVLLNLCTNAAKAMSDTGGLLEVGLAEVEFDKGMVARYPELEPGRYQSLTVTDTGHGMDEKILARIYEPFFTTQKPEEGTGMGLSVVHGIVKNCGGAITVYSLPGTGTTFQLYFPLIQTRRPYLESAEDRPIHRGTERILIVDDEAALVDIGQELLEGLGYQVTAMNSSLGALEAFKARPHEFDLVITDQTMPQMTGFALSRELLQIRPDIPIIICTGFSSRLSVDKARDIGIRRLAIKPLFSRDIAKMIREVLAEKVEG